MQFERTHYYFPIKSVEKAVEASFEYLLIK